MKNNTQKHCKNFGVISILIIFVSVTQSRKEPPIQEDVLTGICTDLLTIELINLT